MFTAAILNGQPFGFARPPRSFATLGVRGTVQREGLVIHVVARALVDLSHHVRALAAADERGALISSRDFH